MRAPRVLFRARPVFARNATIVVGLAIVALVLMVWQIAPGPGRIAALAALPVLAMLFGYICTRYRFVIELAVDGEDLLVRTLFQRSGSPPLRIPVAETSGWREYVETGDGRRRNRIVAFRHRGIGYGMAVDHAVRPRGTFDPRD